MQQPDPRDLRILELEAEVARLLERIAELERRLGLNSRNSSKPPSSDIAAPPKPPREKSGRKRGGQPGHERRTRELLPPDRVDRIIDVIPPHCIHCDSALAGRDPLPERQQVTEVPPLEPKTIEYRYHALECESCGRVTRADRPEGVPAGSFGPRLMAMVAVCTGKYRMSKRMVQELFHDFLRVPLSAGSVCNIESEVSDALAAPVAEAREAVRSEEIAHADETGWREEKKKAWLWVVVTAIATVFEISRSRGAKVAKELLGGDWAGFLVTDRWSAYNWVDILHRQLCWAHLIRDFRAVSEGTGLAAKIGKQLLGQTKEMFLEWQKVRDGTLPRRRFARRMVPVQHRVGRLLRRLEQSGDPKAEGFARDLLAKELALWAFLHVDGLEPTNNTAEREIRHGVLWRKGSFGTDSEQGSRYVERILTTIATLRQHDRSVLEYLTSAVQAHICARPAPPLVPTARQLALWPV